MGQMKIKKTPNLFTFAVFSFECLILLTNDQKFYCSKYIIHPIYFRNLIDYIMASVSDPAMRQDCERFRSLTSPVNPP
jgi:hypothetical protein